MSLEKIVKINVECKLGTANSFEFKGEMMDSYEVLASGTFGQDIDLFRNLLKKLAEVYPEGDSMVVEVQNNEITGVP